MRRSEALIREGADFLRTDLGKSAAGLFGGVICFCFPHIPAYAAGSVALYYCIHRFRPVAAWIYRDLRADVEVADDDLAGNRPA